MPTRRPDNGPLEPVQHPDPCDACLEPMMCGCPWPGEDEAAGLHFHVVCGVLVTRGLRAARALARFLAWVAA